MKGFLAVILEISQRITLSGGGVVFFFAYNLPAENFFEKISTLTTINIYFHLIAFDWW